MIHKIPTNQTIIEGGKVKPGDTVVLSGVYPVAPYCKGLVMVTITNEGPVHLQSGLKVDNCRSLKVIDSTKKYQFKISEPKSGASGINVYNRSTDIEIAYLVITDCSFSGIMIKDDGATRESGFVMQNIHVHHNKISKTGGEPIYIGETKATGHDLKGVHVHDNIISDGGWDGIQVANCVEDCLIHDNRITNVGINAILQKDKPQDNGIQIGERTKAKVYRNKIVDARGQGIIVFGTGCDVYDNRIFRAGESGIYSDTRADSTEPNTFRSNWILAPKMYCIACRDREKKGFKNKATDNRLFNPGKAFFENGNDLTDSKNNNFLGNDMLFVEHLMKSL